MRWGALKNGDLLTAAEASGFEVLVTADQGLGYQQNLDGRRLAVTDARIDSFPCSCDDENSGVPFSTRNPRIPSGVRAQTIAISATDPFVIQVFSPLITHSDPFKTALVNIPAGFDPNPVGLR